MQITNNLKRTLANLPGWRTNRKIVVIESDDWGSICMPSKEVYEECLKNGYPVNLNAYERYDSLASQEDLEALFDLLLSYKDYKGYHPVITANCAVANPDFEKIKDDNFQNYHYELFTETFKKYPDHSDNFNYWLRGKEMGIFYPQFHAREHLNVSKFMNALQINNPDAHFGFMHNMPGCISKGITRTGNYYVAASHYNSEKDREDKLSIYLEGLKIFQQIFGYSSKTIIPPNYTWNRGYNNEVAKLGVIYIQGQRKMREPKFDSSSIYYNRYLGHKEGSNIISLVRNVAFEPSLVDSFDAVDQCLNQINIAFKMKKPAIINSSRVNYVGFINPENRNKNLRYLQTVLDLAFRKWPDIEFMNSEQLGDLINND
jgi:hypothetical protein